MTPSFLLSTHKPIGTSMPSSTNLAEPRRSRTNKFVPMSTIGGGAQRMDSIDTGRRARADRSAASSTH